MTATTTKVNKSVSITGLVRSSKAATSNKPLSFVAVLLRALSAFAV